VANQLSGGYELASTTKTVGIRVGHIFGLILFEMLSRGFEVLSTGQPDNSPKNTRTDVFQTLECVECAFACLAIVQMLQYILSHVLQGGLLSDDRHRQAAAHLLEAVGLRERDTTPPAV
jgi:hypothetical protein